MVTNNSQIHYQLGHTHYWHKRYCCFHLSVDILPGSGSWNSQQEAPLPTPTAFCPLCSAAVYFSLLYLLDRCRCVKKPTAVRIHQQQSESFTFFLLRGVERLIGQQSCKMNVGGSGIKDQEWRIKAIWIYQEERMPVRRKNRNPGCFLATVIQHDPNSIYLLSLVDLSF